MTSSAIAAFGSSPHTRGARPRSATLRIRTPDHPRIRGEHFAIARFAATHRGSSPHTRGARLHGEDEWIPRGIIPAYAGSTAPGWPARRSRQDHPRIRGEHHTKGEVKSFE